jgi:cell division protein FtsN
MASSSKFSQQPTSLPIGRLAYFQKQRRQSYIGPNFRTENQSTRGVTTGCLLDRFVAPATFGHIQNYEFGLDKQEMDTALTRRSEMRPSEMASVPHGLAAAESGAEPAGIPARFRILSEIGYGGMGIVYKVRDLETDEIVALKLLKPEVAGDPKMREELRQEVCLARKVTHKNVCRIHELYRSPASSFISMEFIGGETLLSRLRRGATLSVSESIGIARQICAGLREAHAHGIVHRDLKPANIMIDSSGVVKIMDFGIARHSQENDHSTTTIAGTPEYMAPEQIELKAMGPRTDIYALGLLLYEMMTGTQAFTGETTIAVAVKQLHDSPKRPSEIMPSIPPGLEAVILKCLRKNSESRFQSVDELDTALAKPASASASAARTVALPAISVDVDAMVKSASDKWHVVQPHLVRFGAEVQRVARRVSLLVEIECKKLVLRVVATTPRKVRKSRLVQFAAIATVAVLGISLFALLAGKFSKHDAAMSQAIVPLTDQSDEGAIAAQAPAAMPTSADVPVASTSTMPLENADDTAGLDANAAHPASGDPSTDATLAASAPEDSSSQSDAPNPGPTKKKVPVAKVAPAPVKTKPSPPKKQAKVSAAAIQPAAAVQTVSLITVPTLAPAPDALQPAPAPTDSGSAAASAVKPDSTVETYLEVGSFKDAKWADDAVQRLSQMGFHAICVHKTMLWKLQSYHVQVGPYTTSSEADDAEQKLTAQGFKPHVVK